MEFLVKEVCKHVSFLPFFFKLEVLTSLFPLQDQEKDIVTSKMLKKYSRTSLEQQTHLPHLDLEKRCLLHPNSTNQDQKN